MSFFEREYLRPKVKDTKKFTIHNSFSVKLLRKRFFKNAEQTIHNYFCTFAE